MTSDVFQNVSRCPACGGGKKRGKFPLFHPRSNLLTLIKYTGPEPKTSIVVCSTCSQNYMTPILSKGAMDYYYRQVDSEFHHKRIKMDPEHNRHTYEGYLKIISDLIPPGSRIIEIGCGSGFLLRMLKDAGYEVFGVEPSPLAAEFSRERFGVEVHTGYLADSPWFADKNTFDLVISIDVFEHIPDINPFVTELSSMLKPHGSLFVSTGDIGSLNARIAGPDWGYFNSWEHLSFFTRRSMRLLLQKHGFDRIVIRRSSVEDKPRQNVSEFGKNIIKKILNPLLPRRYAHGLSFDHMLVTARKT